MPTVIPTPSEFNAYHAERCGPLVEAVVAQIVDGMKSAPYGRIIIDLDVPSAIRSLVKERFADAGWAIKYHDDQRDGSSVEVTPLSGVWHPRFHLPPPARPS